MLEIVEPVGGPVESGLADIDDQDVSADPQHRGDPHDGEHGHHLRHRGDESSADPPGERRLSPGERQAHVVHLHDQRDHAVHQHGDEERHDDQNHQPGQERFGLDRRQRNHHDLGGQDQIGPDGSVDHGLFEFRSALRCVRGLVLVMAPGEGLVDLLRSLVAQEQAAGDEKVRQRLRQELAQDHRHREDDQELVADGTDRDLANDRQFAIRAESVHVAGSDRGVVDDHSRGLDARATGRCADVVDGRRCCFRERRDVVQQGDETTSHGEPPQFGRSSDARSRVDLQTVADRPSGPTARRVRSRASDDRSTSRRTTTRVKGADDGGRHTRRCGARCGV